LLNIFVFILGALSVLSKKQKNKLRLKRRRAEKLSLARKRKSSQESKILAENKMIQVWKTTSDFFTKQSKLIKTKT